MVVIAGEAATADDDGDYDINRANVSLAVIRKSVAFQRQGKRKEALASIMRASPRVQWRPANLSHIRRNLGKL